MWLIMLMNFLFRMGSKRTLVNASSFVGLSASLLISQSISQLVSQSVIWSFSHVIDEMLNKLLRMKGEKFREKFRIFWPETYSQSVNSPISPSIRQSLNKLVSQSICIKGIGHISVRQKDVEELTFERNALSLQSWRLFLDYLLLGFISLSSFSIESAAHRSLAKTQMRVYRFRPTGVLCECLSNFLLLARVWLKRTKANAGIFFIHIISIKFLLFFFGYNIKKKVKWSEGAQTTSKRQMAANQQTRRQTNK